jgi:hypothetical protein
MRAASAAISDPATELNNDGMSVTGAAAQCRTLCEADLGGLPPGLPAVGVGTEGDVGHGLVVDALIDHVASDQHLTHAGLERVEVDVPAAKTCALVVERRQSPCVDKDPSALAGGHESEHARSGSLCPGDHAGNDNDVVDPADRCTARVEQW